MEGYRYQQFAYLAVPLLVGFEFFRSARFVRRNSGKESARAVMMEAGGYIFSVLVPAVFFFTIFSLEYRSFPLLDQLLHRLDRYVVMFLFLGSWWQVFVITALRAYRAADGNGGMFRRVWGCYLALGVYISALILRVAPFNLMWFSITWFAVTCGLMSAVALSPRTVSRVFVVLAIFTFFGENILFIVLDAIV